MIEKGKIIERSTPSLNFIEQVQDQIQLCRDGMSNPQHPLTSRVQALECLLWAKLKDDKNYKKRKEELNKWFEEKTKNLGTEGYGDNRRANFSRHRARGLFKQLMVFIDKKNLIPFNENE